MPAAAQARVDEGMNGQSKSASKLVVTGTHDIGLPCAPNCAIEEGQPNSTSDVSVVTEPGLLKPGDQAQSTVKAGDYGMPRATLNDYEIQRGDLIEFVRLNPRARRATMT